MDETKTIEELEAEIAALKRKLKFSVIWDVEHFRYAALEDHHRIYNYDKFKGALIIMLREHDRSNGITWDTVRLYLKRYCVYK
jgi:hypothetical protein